MSTSAPRPHEHDDALPPAGPAWDIARLFPAQGQWSEQDYLDLPGNPLVELVDGSVEALPTPALLHQLIVAFLYEAFTSHVRPRRKGAVLFAPMPVRTGPGRYREPDLRLLGAGPVLEPGDKVCERPDRVVEVVLSPTQIHPHPLRPTFERDP
jgi:Uma2 family endonuclease